MQYYNTDSLCTVIEGRDFCSIWPLPLTRTSTRITATTISDQGILFAGRMFRRENIRRFWVENKSPTMIGGLLISQCYDYLYVETNVMQKTLLAINSYNLQSVWGCLQEMQHVNKKGHKLTSPYWWWCVNFRNGLDRFESWATQMGYVPTDVERNRSPDEILEVIRKYYFEDKSWDACPFVHFQLCRKHFAGLAQALEQMLSQ